MGETLIERVIGSAQPTEGRLWWPSAYADESMPAGRETPDGWLCRLDDGAHAYGIPGDRWHAPTLLVEGAIVAFMWGDPPIEAVLTIAEDGSFTCDPPLPAGEFIHIVGDTFLGAHSVAELVACMREYGEAEPGRHRIGYAPSSDDIPFRFTALDGPPRFVRVEQSARDGGTEEVRRGR